MLYAESNGELIGLIGFRQSKKNRSKHVSEMGPLYIKREYRKAKIGSRLAKTAFKIAKQRGVEKIRLEVNKSNKPAVKFYKKMGFKKVGLLKKELKINGKYYDLIILEKRI